MKTPETEKIEENICGRKEDLVGYLYDDISAGERESFKNHLGNCMSCADEAEAFNRVRDNLSSWQVGFIPSTELSLPRRKSEVFRELIGLFPVWARGAALAATALLLVTFVWAGSRSLLNQTNENTLTTAEIESIVKEAVDKERSRMQQDVNAQMADFRKQMESDHNDRVEAIKAEHRSSMKSLEASLKSEIRKVDRQNSSIRSFFAMDDLQNPWGDSK